ncbi:hypothetical protein GMORB2_7296 [Geosmithia morbida]|uniref:Uncharacterized protein n=1 Tax=Geosmithia morbida TaxID=1094350 RepID=A0A9P4YV12_9HYPO|nr:uncharacterized protein GMORB2_7296 [Geosmithia morbida]KAF4122304.1 hypothetical protein GMORB2_7296 [Geosmithia morbida]
MHVVPYLSLAAGAMAVAVGRSTEYDCVLANRREMVSDAGCGDHSALMACFSSLTTSEASTLMGCYVSAGCTEDEARSRASGAQDRCTDLFPDDRELRMRRGRRGYADAALSAIPTQTVGSSPNPAVGAINTADLVFSDHNKRHNLIFVRSATSGDACLTTSSTSTKICDVTTSTDGNIATGTCSSTLVPVSKCAEGMTCSFDNSGNNICMELQNSLDLAGIIISVAFGIGIALAVATLTYLCCQDRKEQKRLAAKAEATALARAATKKKKAARAQEQRAPLISDRRSPSPGVGPNDPFHDNNRQ